MRDESGGTLPGQSQQSLALRLQTATGRWRSTVAVSRASPAMIRGLLQPGWASGRHQSPREFRRSITRMTISLVALLLACHPAALLADEGPPEEPLAQARLLVDQLWFGMDESREGQLTQLRMLERITQPVMEFSDPTQGHVGGTVWLWGPEGRPAAVLELYRNQQEDWVYAMQRLTDRQLLTSRLGNSWWQPAGPAPLAFDPLPDQPQVAESAAGRLLQFRALARRFTAHQFWDPGNTRTELRLIPRPLHRYSDHEAGIMDGVVFSLARGTNTEIVLLLEVQRVAQKSEWRFAAARLGHAELHLEFDGKPVWAVERAQNIQVSTDYWLDYVPRRAVVWDRGSEREATREGSNPIRPGEQPARKAAEGSSP